MACGGGSQGDTRDDGSGTTTHDDGGSDASATHVVGPPPLDDGGSASADADDDAGDTGTLASDAGDAGNASSDAGDAGDASDSGGCSSSEKTCGGTCVPIDDPAYGCTATSCAACAISNAATAACSAGACAAATCDTSYHLCNAACDPNSDLPTQDSCEVSETFGVFVSSSLGATGNPGTRAAPLKTIQAAITLAASTGKRVYACAESYAEADTLASNVSIFGYFTCAGGSWSVGSGHATVTAPTSPAVTAANVSGVQIYNVDWIAPSQAADSSASAYGMFATTSTLTLVNVGLTAGAGGSGANGGQQPAETVASSCPPSDGFASSSPGANGPTTTLRYTIAGTVVAVGVNGASGPAGDDGTAGGAGTCTYNATSCPYDSADRVCEPESTQVCASSGTAGCGGPGGAGGLGGGGGGSSIALFAWQSTITVSGGQLAAGNGGAGGAGASGLAAPPISNFPACLGAPGSNETVSVHGCNAAPGCGVDHTVESVPLTGGTSGGNGGLGGNGGNGAGGGGGDSYSYYKGESTTVTIGTGVTLTNGTPGTAGGGPIPGNAGHAAAYNTLD